jgi:hypothetical protein
MCEFCEKGKRDRDVDTEIYLQRGVGMYLLCVHDVDRPSYYSDESFIVKFCPKCGRKLY